MLHFLEGCFRKASERFPKKTTSAYSLVEGAVNIVNLNITLSYKQLYRLRMEAGSGTAKPAVQTVRGGAACTHTPNGACLGALHVYLSLLGPLPFK